MAAQNAVRRVVVEGKSTGLDKVERDLRAIGDAGAQASDGLLGVTKSTETVEKRTISTERAFVSLHRRLDEGARAADQMARGQRTLDAALEQAVIDLNQYNVSLGQLKGRYDAATIAAKADAQAAAALRAQVDPLGTAQARLNAEMAEYAGLASRGAINAKELAAAQSLARQRFDATAASISRLNVAANSNVSGGMNTANIAAQFQDIGVTAAMGMSPLQIALQQGTQLQAVLGPMGAAGAVRALGAAFLSLINPVSLATLGLVAAGAALIQYFMSANEDSRKANDELREHAALIKSVATEWGDVIPALEAYNNELERQAALRDLRQATDEFADKKYKQVDIEFPNVRALYADVLSIMDPMSKEIGKVQAAFGTLADEIDANNASLETVTALIDLLNNSASKSSQPVLDAVSALENLRLKLEVTNGEVEDFRLNAVAIEFGSNIAAALRPAIDALEKDLLPRLREFWGLVKKAVEIDQEFTDRAAKAFQSNHLNGIELGDARVEFAENLAKAQDKAASAYDRVIERATDRNAQLQIELKYLGDFSVEAQAAVYAQQLMNQAISDGKSLTPEQTAEINRLAQAYAELSQAIGIARAEQALQFERDQITRSPIDQKVYATLRQLGLDINDAKGQQLATDIRINEELKQQQRQSEQIRDILKDGASSFLQDLFSGKDVLESIVQLGSRFASMNFDAFVNGVGGLMGGRPSAANTNIPVAKAAGQALGSAAAPIIAKTIGDYVSVGGPGAGFSSPGRAVEVTLSSVSSSKVQQAGNAFLDLVASRESRGDYNATLMDGKFTGGPRNLIGMTLDQIDAMQSSMLKHTLNTFNSSAVGRYQIVQSTLRGLKQEFGLSGDTLFTPKLQDELAMQLARARGANAEGLRNEWAGLKGISSETIIDAYRKGVQGQTQTITDAVQTGATDGTRIGATKGVETGVMKLGNMASDVPGGGKGGFGLQGFAGLLGAGLGGFSTGYQAANPGMGALGGAVQGLGAGMELASLFPAMAASLPIIGVAVGAVAGLLGGILGARSKLKQARRELEKNMDAINNLLDIGFGKGMGNLQKQIADFNAEADKAVPLAWKAKRMDLVAEIHASQRSFFSRLAKQFYDSFDETISAYGSGLGLDSPIMKGAKAMGDLREELRNFIADTRYFGEQARDAPLDPANKPWWIENHGQERWEEEVRNQQEKFDRTMAQATESAISMILAMVGGAKEFTEYESAVMAVQGAIKVAKSALVELGLSAGIAAEALDKQLNSALKKLQSAYIDDVSRSLYDLADVGFMGDLLDAQKRYNDRLRDAAALGLSADLANRELALSLRNIVREAKLTDDQIRQLAAAMPELSSSLMGLIGAGEGVDTAQALADAQAKVEDAKAALRSAYEKERSELESTISRLKSFTEGIRNFKDSLKLDKDLSPLDAAERLAEAQRQFQETAAKAMGTGPAAEAAQGRLEEVSRAYLEEARSYYGSNEMYYAVWQEVNGTLDKALAKAEGQLSTAEKQLAALEQQVKGLIDIDDSVKSVEEAIADLEAAQAEETAAKAADDAYKNSLFAEMLAVMKAQLAAQDAARIAQEQAAADIAAQIAASNAEAAAAAAAAAQAAADAAAAAAAATAAKAAEGVAEKPKNSNSGKKYSHEVTVGMASGGWVTGGIPGLDSVRTMLMPGEFVMPAPMAQRYRPEMEAMRGGWYSGVANDNSALVAVLQASLRDMAAELEALRAIVAQGFSASVASTDRTAGAMEHRNRQQATEGRRKAP